MPLPANGTPWPPKELAPITIKLAEWAAWWTGDPEGLERTYSPGGYVRPAQYAGGVVGAVARFWWGRPRTDNQSPRKLHIPIAADLCQASADLLYGEAPAFVVDDEAAQERLDELVDDGMLQALMEGAEEGAALGGHFLRVTWDQQVSPDRPFVTAVSVDAALPEFRWGRLLAVTFWHVVDADGQLVTRHLERHELDASGNGVIVHGLYRGSAADLGVRVPLTEHSTTEGLAQWLTANGDTNSTGNPGLACVHVPNQRPQRRWRSHPIGQHYGRSDLDQLEGAMDALDEAYSSWMRDIRLGKARLLVPASSLDDLGAGKGAAFDTDREVFSTLNVAPTSLASGGGSLAQAEQFAIRHEEHRATCRELLERIIATAGYSANTFGLDDQGGATTATEIRSRQQRSYATRDRKLRLLRPALATLVEKLLAVDAALFGSGITPSRPHVEFPDGVQEGLLALAQTAQALRAAEAASTETLVRMLHPEWDDGQVAAEVEEIMGEKEAANPPLPDPTDPTLVNGANPVDNATANPVDNATDVPPGA